MLQLELAPERNARMRALPAFVHHEGSCGHSPTDRAPAPRRTRRGGTTSGRHGRMPCTTHTYHVLAAGTPRNDWACYRTCCNERPSPCQGSPPQAASLLQLPPRPLVPPPRPLPLHYPLHDLLQLRPGALASCSRRQAQSLSRPPSPLLALAPQCLLLERARLKLLHR